MLRGPTLCAIVFCVSAQYPTWNLNMTGVYFNATTGHTLATKFQNTDRSAPGVIALCTVADTPPASPTPREFGAWTNGHLF